jgi:hypothetical protein
MGSGRLRICVALAAVAATLAAGGPANAAAPDPAFTPGPDGAASTPRGGSGVQVGEECPGDFNGDGRDDIASVEEGVAGIKISLAQPARAWRSAACSAARRRRAYRSATARR